MYDAALFVHLLGVALLIAAVTTSVLVTLRAHTAKSVAEIRVIAAVTRKIDIVIGPAMLFILAAGLYMVAKGGDDGSIHWSSGWVDVALTIFAVMSILGPTIESGHAKQLLAAAEKAPDGPVVGELDALRRAAVPVYVSLFGAFQILAFLFLMTNKPGLGSAIATCAVAAVVGLGLAALRVRQIAAPSATATAKVPQQAAPVDVPQPVEPTA